ncbi:MFS transporter [Deminuibacter soli]|uniref:MFS transporter n=1 Tax=Deminuibacter soli TaxID=2291815 RepID=A0A3E1NGP3_9BACT|nr:MFS transporter [Deminuibacter soli]RFM27052.1 MFS transporter [Deminuibacter soli]
METTFRATAPPGEQRQLNYALTGIALIIFMVNLDASIVVVGLPTLVKSFNTGFDTAQWIVLSYILAVTACIAGAGRLGDLFGKKKLYLLGIIVFIAASVCCGLATRAAHMIAFRSVQGAGAAFCLALSFALAGDLVPKEKLGKTMGILTTMVPLGIASGPTIGGLLITAWGWPCIFLINLPVGVLALWFIQRFTPAVKPVKNGRVDITGMLLLAALLSCYALGMTTLEGRQYNNPLAFLLLVASAVLLVAFITWERKTAHPFLPVHLFTNAVLNASLIAAVMVYIVMTATIILFPFYLTRACGYKTWQTGLVMSFGPLVTALLSVQAGKLSDKYGARKLMLYGVLAMIAGCVLMDRVNPANGLPAFLLGIGVIQVGLTFFQTPNNAAVMELAGAGERGLFSGLLSLSRSTGQITGAAVMGAVFAIAVHSAGGTETANAAPAAITHGMHQVFRVSVLLLSVAALLIYAALRKQQKMLIGQAA